MYKYLFTYVIAREVAQRFCRIMDEVARHTGINPPHFTFAPHLTFHAPLVGFDREAVLEIAREATFRMRQTSVVTSGLFPFGKQYLVIPALQTRDSAKLSVGIEHFLSQLPKESPSVCDSNNLLHVPVASDITSVFDRVWTGKLRGMNCLMTIPVREAAICGKMTSGGRWERIASFPIPA